MRISALSLTAALSGLLAACAPAATTRPAATQPAPVTTTTPAPAAPSLTQSFTVVTPLSAAPVRTFNSAPAQVTDVQKSYRAILKTSRGDVTLELLPKAAPVAVNNFVFLALNRFYDGTRFHRVIDGFMAQGGDPLSADTAQQSRWGTGGPGYQFAAEVNNGLRFDRAGVLGMARSQSLTSQGSQFFITVAPADFLSGGYTVFGRVLAGQDVLDKLTRNYNNAGPIAGAAADTLLSVQILQSP